MPDEERETVVAGAAGMTPQSLALFIGLTSDLSPLIT